MEAVLKNLTNLTLSRKRWIVSLVWMIAIAQLSNGSTDSCWNNDQECLVHATLHKNTSVETNLGREALSLDIDCVVPLTSSSTHTSTKVTPPPDYLMRRFERADAVTLNGCHKGFKWATFGFEFLPNCDKITEVLVERFHADALYAIHCPSATFIQVEVLRFERNDIATITSEIMANLALLRELYFKSNALRHLEKGAFDDLHFVELLHLVDESLLALKEASIFKNTHIADLHMIRLKHVTSTLFGELPETLREIYVEKTSIGVGAKNKTEAPEKTEDSVVNINNPQLLRNVTIIDCGLRVFKLNDDHGSVIFLNLSGNALIDFQITTNRSAQVDSIMKLKILDLSRNDLTHLPLQWLKGLNNLEKLYLHCNLLKQLPFVPLLTLLPTVQSIELQSNKLQSLSEATDNIDSELLYRVRIRMDNNPWNCMWLLKFAHSHPEKFRIFQYDKFLSQINVNGLECVPSETTHQQNVFNASTRVSTINVSKVIPTIKRNGTTNNIKYMNISTFTLVYGSPWEVKRNQRTEALILVFMLPVGIAILFLFLYLWIYCQKVFHLSFYRKCPLFGCGRQGTRGTGVTNRFDVVRQLPPNSTMTSLNNNDGYEMPLNGVSPICNCVNSANNSTDDKCQKGHHITYVPLPDEQAQKIYEEIIASREDNTSLEVAGPISVHPIYDHLTFE